MKVPAFTWTGGVIDTDLAAHVDLNKYLTGLAECDNFQILTTGGVKKRGGLRYVNKRRDLNSPSKLYGWSITFNDSYMLEFSNLRLRFIRFGGYVSHPGGGTPPDNHIINDADYMAIVTPYTAADLINLKFTSANDTLEIMCKGHQPRILKRLGLTHWQFVLKDFDPHGEPPTGLTALWERYNGAVWQSAAMDEPDYDETPENYSYKISATLAGGIETVASNPVTVLADISNTAFRIKLTWTAVPGATQYTLYKGRSGIFGFIGFVQSTDPLVFYDKNYAPSYDLTPIKRFEGFGNDEWPTVTEFYKQRQVYANTPSKSGGLWISRSLFFNSLTTSIPLQDNDAINATLLGRKKQVIYHMVEARVFMIFTSVAEFILKTNTGGALTPATIDPVIETNYGSNPYLTPLVIGDRVLFVQAESNAVLDIGYTLQADHYMADDLTKLSMSMVFEKELTAWTYALAPDSTIYVTYDKPQIACMVYARQHEVWGWFNYSTLGIITDVASVSEGSETGVYYQITREIGDTTIHTIERLDNNRKVEKIEDNFYLDCGLTAFEKSTFTAATFLTINSLTFDTPLGSINKGDVLKLDFADKSIRVRVDSVAGATVTAFLYETIEDVANTTAGLTGTIWRCSKTFGGFTHLAGATVVVLGDGYVYKDIEVAESGDITLPDECAKVQVGLPYSAALTTLSLDADAERGRYEWKTINSIVAHVKNCHGLEVTAEGSSEWQELAVVYEDIDINLPAPPLNGVYKVTLPPVSGMLTAVKARSTVPLPCQILTIVPDITYDKD